MRLQRNYFDMEISAVKNYKKKFTWIWFISSAILIIAGAFVFRTIRNTRTLEQADQNGQALIEIISELEEGDILFLDDIVLFEWDSFVFYDLYTPRDTNRTCMGNPWFNDFTMSTYLCFFIEDSLVARITSPPREVLHLLNYGELAVTTETPPLSEITPFNDFVIDEALIGMWQCDLTHLDVFLVFDADGTGAELQSSENRFAWTTENSYLIMEGDFSGYFTYSIADDTLTLIDVENGIANEFYRID